NHAPQCTGNTWPFRVIRPSGLTRNTLGGGGGGGGGVPPGSGGSVGPSGASTMIVPLILALLIVELANAPLPFKPPSRSRPTWIGLTWSESGFMAVRVPEASAAVMLPFHAGPAMLAAPPSRNPISNEVIGLGNAVSAIRTAPMKPPLRLLVGSTSTVM